MGARSSPDESLLGRVIDGRYRIDAFVGQGGYGVVCQGMQLSVDRRVAIKLLLPEHTNDREMQLRFAREARLASRIRNRHVVQLLDFGLAGAVPYIIMEWLEGPTLKQFQRAFGRLPWPIAAMIARDIAEGLSDAHELGLAHRDLKPSNILLTTARGAVRPVIVDFGLAKAFLKEEHLDDDTLTSANMMLGTPAYMAPETVAGDELDGRGDLYALGILLCEMISGRLPFRGRTQMETATQHLVGKRPDAEFFAGTETPDDLISLVISLLDREPASRPGSAARVAEMLDVFAQEMTSEQRTSLFDTVTNSNPAAKDASGDIAQTPDKVVELDSGQRARLTTLFELRPDAKVSNGDEQRPDVDESPTTSKIILGSEHRDPAGAHRTVAPRQSIERADAKHLDAKERAEVEHETDAFDDQLYRNTHDTTGASDEREGTSRKPAASATSRSGLTPIAAIVLVLIAIAVFFVIEERTDTRRAVGAEKSSGAVEDRLDKSGLDGGDVSAASSAVSSGLGSEPKSERERAGSGQVDADAHIGTATLDNVMADATDLRSERSASDARARPPDRSASAQPTFRSIAAATRTETEQRPVLAGAGDNPANARAPQGPTDAAIENVEPDSIALPSADTSAAIGQIEGMAEEPVIPAVATMLDPDELPASPPPVITIRSRPWAEIFIDGQSQGSHSVLRWQPPRRGLYTIRAVNGEASHERSVGVEGDNGATVRFMFVQ